MDELQRGRPGLLMSRPAQTGAYIVQSSDRFRRLKVVVTLRNPHGTAGTETLLSPIITG